jgi:COP9 signalosome complex subunit 4
MENRLSQLATLSQKDKGPAYLSLLSDILTRPDQSSVSKDLQALLSHVLNQESVGLVVGRQVLSELVKALDEGAIKSKGLHREIVQETLSAIRPRIASYEEQVRPKPAQVGLAPEIVFRQMLCRSNLQTFSKQRKTGVKPHEF